MIKRIWILTLAAILLQSCGSFASIPAPLPAPVSTAVPPPQLPTALPPIEPTSTQESIATISPTPRPKVSRVLIVSFDGLRPDAIQAGNLTTTLGLMKTGAYTLKAQTIKPSWTLTSYAAMLVGTCPAKNIARWDEFVPENGYALGVDLFDVAHAAGLRTVMTVAQEKLSQITEPTSTDFFSFVDKTDKIEDTTSVLRLALDQISQGFGLMFVEFAEGDTAGHEKGWMSREQLDVYAREDKGLGEMLLTLQGKGMYDDTLIMVVSDHGGHDQTYGTDIPEDMTIPWIVSGPGIVPGELSTQVYIMDTAATAAYALGLSIPPEWDGIPVYEAFGMTVDPFRGGGC